MTRYITNADFRRQKAALTRAINSGDPLKVLDTVEKTLKEWHGKAWPDDWSRWLRALEDAWATYERNEYYDRLTEVVDRFRDAHTRLT